MDNRKEIGVLIGNKHTYKDFGLIMTDKVISSPEVQIKLVEVPGRNGTVDMTEVSTGDVRYKDRTISLKFATQKKVSEWDSLISELRNHVCGMKFQYIFDDDLAFYWVGRCTQVNLEVAGMSASISMTIIVDPYKYTIQSTLEDWLWDPFDFEQSVINEFAELEVKNSLSVEIIGNKKFVNPIIIASSPMTVTFNRQSYSVVKGSQVMYDIVLSEGSDVLVFTGNGKVSINYVGGSL